MALIKHGEGRVIPEQDDQHKTASEDWSESDEKDLQKEIEDE